MTDDDRDRPLLKIRDLTLGLSSGRLLQRRSLTLVDRVSFSVQRGEILGIIGESGSGKTTLGKTILGLREATAGSIELDGVDLTRLSPGERSQYRRRIQMVFQDPLSSFNPRFRVGSSLALPLRLHGLAGPSDWQSRISDLLALVGLSASHCRRFPHELSGGQLQRVALARALSVEPDLIVADEPVSKLDVSVRAQVLNSMKRLNIERGTSTIFITHDLDVARFLCHRIAVMYFGRLIEIGPTAEILSAPRHPYTAHLLGASTGSMEPLDETTLDPRGMGPSSCHYRDRCPRRLALCATSRPDIAGGAACFNPLSGSIDRRLSPAA